MHLVLHPSTLPFNPLEHICGRDLRRPDKEGLPRRGGASRPRGLQAVQGEDVLTGTGETQNPSCYLGTSIHTGLLHTLEFGEFTGAPPSNQRLPPDFSLPCSAMPPAPPGPDALFAREGQQQSKYLPFLCLIQGFKRIKVVFYDQICISLSSSVPFTVRQSPLIFSEQQRSVRTHKHKMCQVPNLRPSDSTKKHHFNLMFLAVSITLHTVDMD